MGKDASGSEVPQWFCELLADSQRSLYVYATALLQNGTDAQEVLQEANIILCQKYAEFQRGTDFIRWASRVTYFEALKHRRKRSRKERLFSDGFINILAVEAMEPAGADDAHRNALRSCLDKVTDEDRRLVLARYEVGATTRSVAQRFGRSVQGTRKSLHRIRKKLLHCIERTVRGLEQ
jgi:RNA polymerase sigma-70 factor (ECF subfamily)